MADGICRICGCTDADCSECVEKTGEPCSWVEADLCSACAPGGEQLDKTKLLVRQGLEAFGFDLVVVVSVQTDERSGVLHFECALDGLVPPTATSQVADALKEIAQRVKKGMDLQTVAHRRRERSLS